MAAVFHTALCPFIPWYVHMTGDCNLCAVSACLIQLRESGHCLGLPRWWGGGGGGNTRSRRLLSDCLAFALIDHRNMRLAGPKTQ